MVKPWSKNRRRQNRRAHLGGEDITMSDIREWKHNQEEKAKFSWVYKQYQDNK